MSTSKFVTLGRTGLLVSRIAFGAGPVSGLMTGDNDDLQRRVIQRAIESGVNWIDTAAGYGNGTSERNVGRALEELRREPGPSATVHVATKVRVTLGDDPPRDVRSQVLKTVEASLERLQLSSVTLLQLHNGLTTHRDDAPASVSVEDVLGCDGIASALEVVRDRGLAKFIGLTGTGHPEAMRTVIRSSRFDTIQLPYNILNSSAGQEMPADFAERNYGNILRDCREMNLGVFAIRVFAAGALLGNAPSAHTLKTPYFPLDLYERDSAAAIILSNQDPHTPPSSRAIQFSLSHPAVHSAIIGFGEPAHVDDAMSALVSH